MVVIDGTGPRVTRGTVVRFLSPLSDRWNGTFLSEGAAYAVHDGIAFYACHFDKERHAIDFYTDFDDLRLEEVRLLTSLALTVGYQDGLRFVYPDPTTLEVPEHIDLSTRQGLTDIWELIRAYLDQPQRRASSDPPLPNSTNMHERDEWGVPLNAKLQRLIFERTELSNHVLLRGLATWIKAGMLWSHRSFAEEANYSLYVSLDASFAVVRDFLQTNGNRSPTAHDAAEFLHAAFGEESSGMRYFEEFYEDRIRTMHPESRFGQFAYAPLGRDDFYWLFRALREVWRLLILGQAIDPPPIRY